MTFCRSTMIREQRNGCHGPVSHVLPVEPELDCLGQHDLGPRRVEDQVTWKDYPDALLPFQDKWDNLGVFSGFSMNNAIDGKHTVFYTGVTALPISWKKEYRSVSMCCMLPPAMAGRLGTRAASR
ncbi:unnamed protein product [Phytophthora lilii]|uniref:Unnamed protein product n=1 Tax=Phytophthora lilii TaxID=2077276 RepID=A0A9W6TDI1_9STRA|nr:unnamed protein product [Phytophthora lilii]